MASLIPLVGLLATAGAAPRDAPPPSTVNETSILAGLGLAGGEGTGGLGLTLLATHRWRFLELGVDAHVSAFISHQAGLGGVGGFHFGDQLSLRLLGGAGFHSYGGIGRGLLSDDPGVSGAVPYAGGRVVLGYSFRSRPGLRHRGFIGLMGGLDQDLAREKRTVTYLEEGWLFGGTTEQTSVHTVGQLTMSGFLVAGVDLDLLSY